MALSTHWLADDPARFLVMQNYDLSTRSDAKGSVSLFDKLELSIAISLRGELLYFNGFLALEILTVVPGKSIKDHVLSAMQEYIAQGKLNDPQFIDLGFEKPLYQATSNPKVMRLAVLLTVSGSNLTDPWVEANTGGYWKHHFGSDEATASLIFGHILGPAVLRRFWQFDQAYIQSLVAGNQQQRNLALSLFRNTIELYLQVQSVQTQVRWTEGVIAYVLNQPQRGISLLAMPSAKLSSLGDSLKMTVQGQHYNFLAFFGHGQAQISEEQAMVYCNLAAHLFQQDGRQNIIHLNAAGARFHTGKPLVFRSYSVTDQGDVMDTSSG